ncbi:MAG TPA: glycosyltransferase family 4 protein [Acidobacteriota bacterium]|nr:glycosyltransferase family 4 protein [Acidobacteriota bacterium]
MTIVHIDTGMGWRGGQSQAMMLMEGLSSYYKCNIILIAKKGSMIAEKARAAKIECLEIPARFEADLPSAFKIAQLNSKKQPAFLHAHTPHGLGLAIMATKIGTRVPILYTRRVSFAIPKHLANKWKLKQATRIIAVSSAVAKELMKAGVPSEKLQIIHSAVDTSKFQYHGPDLTKPYSIAVLGSIEKQKGIEMAMQFIELASNLPVIFHFSGTGPLLAKLENFAQERSNVKVHGFVSNIPEFLQKMFGAITFSPSEGFPNMVLQSMASGLPVLAYANEPIREIITGPEYGTVFRTNDEALAALQAYIAQSDYASETGKRASEFVSNRFSHKQMVEKTYQLYRELAS